MGEIITFYSYRGGVGRTMALANVAVILAQWRYKVLMIDWHLEAPGLEFYFKDFIRPEETGQQPGIIELLYDSPDEASKGKPSVKWQDFVVEISLPNNAASLHFLTPGKIDNDYFNKVSLLNLDSFYSERNGGVLIEYIRNEWKQTYDFILIDSQTGITDIGGICTVQLPDILALFFTATDQALQGAVKVAKNANLNRQKLPVDRFSLQSLPVVCRFDKGKEKERPEKWLKRFAENLSSVYENWLPDSIKPFEFLEATYIPYVPYFSFGENLPVLEQGTNDPGMMGYAYETLAALLAHKLESVEQLMDNRDEFVKSVASYKRRKNSGDNNALVTPFHHGNPVPAELFLGRVQEIQLIINRITNHGQSSAIIGEPRSGKTSLLQYVSNSEIRSQLYGTYTRRLLFSFLDLSTVSSQCNQAAFWKSASYPLRKHISSNPDSSLAKLYQICRENDFDTFWLEQLFQQMRQDELCLILMLDEFDVLLNHRELNSSEFYGNLRSLASRTGALALVMASRQSLYKLNEATQTLSPTGSPFFNFISKEIHLGPLGDDDVMILLDKSKGRFTENDRSFIIHAAGAHVFLLQVAASSLWEAYAQAKEDAVLRWKLTAEELLHMVNSMLNDMWKIWTPETRMVITAIALAWMPSLQEKHNVNNQFLLRNMRLFRTELHILKKQGFIQEDDASFCSWRIRPAVLLWWLADELEATIRDEQLFEQWLRIQKWDGLLTSDEWQEIKGFANAFEGNAAELIDADINKLLDREPVHSSLDKSSDKQIQGSFQVTILHLSDIHLGTSVEADTYLRHLESDLKKTLQISRLDYLVISGDVTNLSTQKEYEAAYITVHNLMKAFNLSSERVVIAPGNHDVNWEMSENAYENFIPRRKLPRNLSERNIRHLDKKGELKGAFKCDEEEYKKRFIYFCDFYEKLTGVPYPLTYAKQGILHNFPEHRIQFLCLNSSWEVDHNYTERAGINPEALNDKHSELINQKYEGWLKIGVWHHPVTGPEQIKDTGFLEQLARYGFQIGMHGHLHEAQDNFFRYDDIHGMRIVGAGTFGAPSHEQRSGIPLQYNLLTFDTKFRRELVVHTRKKEKPNGIWEADARWGDKGIAPKPEYTIKLHD